MKALDRVSSLETMTTFLRHVGFKRGLFRNLVQKRKQSSLGRPSIGGFSEATQSLSQRTPFWGPLFYALTNSLMCLVSNTRAFAQAEFVKLVPPPVWGCDETTCHMTNQPNMAVIGCEGACKTALLKSTGKPCDMVWIKQRPALCFPVKVIFGFMPTSPLGRRTTIKPWQKDP